MLKTKGQIQQKSETRRQHDKDALHVRLVRLVYVDVRRYTLVAFRARFGSESFKLAYCFLDARCVSGCALYVTNKFNTRYRCVKNALKRV